MKHGLEAGDKMCRSLVAIIFHDQVAVEVMLYVHIIEVTRQ